MRSVLGLEDAERRKPPSSFSLGWPNGAGEPGASATGGRRSVIKYPKEIFSERNHRR
jgi:hypothetical protein